MQPNALMFSDALVHRLSQLLYRCLEEVGSTKAALYLTLPGAQDFRLVSHFGWPRMLPPPERLGAEHPLLNLLHRERRGVMGDDLAAYPELAPFCAGSLSPRFYAVPIFDHGEWIGVLLQRDPSRGESFQWQRQEAPTQPICHAVAQALASFLVPPAPERVPLPPLPPAPVAAMVVPAPPTNAMVRGDAPGHAPIAAAVPARPPIAEPATNPALRPAKDEAGESPDYPLEQGPTEGDTLLPEQRTFFWEAASLLCRMVPAGAVALYISDGDRTRPILTYSRAPLGLELKGQVMANFMAQLPHLPRHELRLVSRSEWYDREAQQGQFQTLLPVLLEEQFGDDDLLMIFRLEDRPFTGHEQEFISQVSRMLAFYLQEARLHERYHESFLSVSMRILASADGRLPSLRVQSVNTAQLSRDLARRLDLPTADVEAVGISAILHDVGTLLLDRTILDKPALSAADRAQVETHPILASTFLKDFKFPFDVMRIIRHHHESWDGRGYPDGLRGEAIPIGSRIIHLVESYEVMTTGTAYKPAKPMGAALAELNHLAGQQFDPAMVTEFIQMLKERHL